MMTIIAAIACGQAMNSARTSVAAVAKITTPTTARVETPLATPIVSATSEPATIATGIAERDLSAVARLTALTPYVGTRREHRPVLRPEQANRQRRQTTGA